MMTRVVVSMMAACAAVGLLACATSGDGNGALGTGASLSEHGSSGSSGGGNASGSNGGGGSSSGACSTCNTSSGSSGQSPDDEAGGSSGDDSGTGTTPPDDDSGTPSPAPTGTTTSTPTLPPFMLPDASLGGGMSMSGDGGANACSTKICIDPVFDCPLQGCFNGCTNFLCN